MASCHTAMLGHKGLVSSTEPSDELAKWEILCNHCDKERKEGGSQHCGESPATQDSQRGLL